MGRQFPAGLVAAIGIMTAGTVAGVFSGYSRPNLGVRSTDQLSADVMREADAHAEDCFPLQLLRNERQRYMVAELARRSEIRFARLKLEAASEPQPCPNRVLSLVATAGPRH